MTQPVGPIQVQAPVPSILTTARDRTRDDFGRQVPVEATTPDGSSPPSSASWRTGVTWAPLACQPSFSWPQCPDPDAQRNADTVTGPPAESNPFWIYTPLECEWALDDQALDDASVALTNIHSAFQLAEAIWMGEG